MLSKRGIMKSLCGLAAAGALGMGMLAPAQAQNAPGILQSVIQRGTLRIAVLGSMQPYSRVLPTGEAEGYDIDIAKRLAAALKVKPEFIISDIPTRVTALQTRKADVTIADFTRTVERSTSIAFTNPYLVTTMRLLLPANSPYKSIAEANEAGIRVAISRGGTAEQAVPANMPKVQIIRFNTQADELNAVLSGQADGMAEDNFYNANAIKENPGKLKEAEGDLNRAEIAIGAPAGDADWLRVLNLFVDQFNASGDNKKLFLKWFGFPQPPIQTQY